ncbi:OLC1v1009133C1 [Oldenlandia corymbosa var. corymbosa]|uniref:OLC1v1009133C1 n=1 Tax=Oldenlandia corymbosa var. corymbosa TaxID=529605 RepID=A0AAV1DNG4_OLDCO|nr:OLC1v1009133C1 [Oldenlandia corymbosa var. corymbosa]
MSVPDAAVNSLLQNLSQVCTIHRDFLESNNKDIISSLVRELRTLKGVLGDFVKYGDGPDGNEQFKELMKETRSIVNEVEDEVDRFIAMSTEQKSRTISKVLHSISGYTVANRKAAKTIQDLGDKLRNFIEVSLKNAYSLVQHQAVVHELGRQRTNKVFKVEEDHVIGFDEAGEEVRQLLTEGSEQLEVISIVGMVGLGKTTLARMAYKDPVVDYQFMIRAFIRISKEFDRREVYLEILKSIMKISDEVTTMSGDHLEELLCQRLEGRQYLIVLDDVWEKRDWDMLKSAFPKNNRRCRVLITTRNTEVANYANARIYKLGFLKLDHSRELLRWRVFHQDSLPQELEMYEMEIVMKCDGLPLSLVVVAGILLNHRDRSDWWKHVANSVSELIAKDHTQSTQLIELTYKHLPNHLKPCFLYLGLFMEDFEIPVWKLVRLWIAEGLISEEDGGTLSLETLAKSYLEELISRNLVMVGRRRSNEEIKTCRIQNTVKEFCKKTAMEENIFQEIKNPSMFSDQFRRICITDVGVLKQLSSNPSGSRARSILFCSHDESPAEEKIGSAIPKSFQLLKVLECDSLVFTRFPLALTRLVLLKYISISSRSSVIPASLSALRYMQTLIVKTISPTLEIKVDVWELPEFRHLHTNASTMLPYPSKEKQNETDKNIQTLSTISTELCRKEVFDRTPNLKKLSIGGTLAELFVVQGESSFFDSLSRLERLENLKLLNDKVSRRLSSLPSPITFPPWLRELTLSNTNLEWKEMTVLGKLEKLEVLKLKEFAFRGNFWETEKGGFRCLNFLRIGQTDLLIWKVSSDDFPRIRTIELVGCDKLQGLPPSLADIPTFQSLRLNCTNPQVASSARRLHVLKLKEGARKQGGSNFKLSIYPPDY